MLVASTCSVKLFKRKQKLKTWRGLANCLQIASAGTIQRTKTSFARDVLRFIHRNEYTGFIKESWKEQERLPLLRQAA